MVILKHLFWRKNKILIEYTIENVKCLWFLWKIFNNFTVISCIFAKFSSHTTHVLMVILQHLFWRKNNFFIEYTIENVTFLWFLWKNFKKFTLIYCIVAIFSLHITDVLLVILQNLFWRKNKILIEHTIENEQILWFLWKIFNNFSLIYCIVAKLSSHTTDVLMVILN